MHQCTTTTRARIGGPLSTGVVRLLTPAGETLGYCYTEDSERGQLQRWVLSAHPQGGFSIATDAARADWDLATWREAVRSELWTPGAFYVLCQCDVYEHGGVYDGVDWTEIPARLPPVSFPGDEGFRAQLDPGGKTRILQRGELGYAFTAGGLDKPTSVEHWVMPSGFSPAGGAADLETVITSTSLDGVVVMGGDESRLASGAAAGCHPSIQADDYLDVQTFILAMNRNVWGPGCVYALIGCLNYRGIAPPASP